MLNNYGSEFQSHLIFFGIFAICMALRMLIEKLKNRKVLYYSLSIIFLLPFSLFDPDNMVGLLDGSRIEIIRLAVLNIKEYKPNTAQKVGVAASLASILFYVVFYKFVFRFTQDRIGLYKLSITAEISSNTISAIQTESTPKAKTIKKQNKSVLDYLFQDYRKSEIKTWYFYIPLMDMLKDVLSQLFLVLLGGSNLYQLYLLMAVELFGLALAVCSIRAERGFKRFSKMLI